MSLCPFHRPGVASSLAPPPTWGGLGNLLESTVSVQACSSPKLLSRERLCSYFTIFQLVLETLTSELLGEGVRATWAPSNKTPGWGFVSHMVSVSVTQFCPCWCSSHRHSKGTWLCANKTWFTKSGLGADSVCCSRSIYTELFLNGHYNFKGAFIATLVSHSPGRQISQCRIHSFYIQGRLRSLVPYLMPTENHRGDLDKGLLFQNPTYLLQGWCFPECASVNRCYLKVEFWNQISLGNSTLTKVKETSNACYESPSREL